MEKNIYLAGKQNAAELSIAEFAVELEENGHHVNEKWWERGVLTKPYLDNLDTSAPAAVAMMKAAKESDVFVLFAEDNLFGALVEFGAALASVEQHPGKKVYVVTPQETFRQSIFYGHPDVIVSQSLQRIRDADWFRVS